MPYETRYGSKGIWYTYYALAPLTAACQVALNASEVDLFHYTSPNGRNIRMALDYLFYYSQHPEEWPHYEGDQSEIPDPHSWPGNLFMAMASVYENDDYENWVTSSGPVYDSSWWSSVHITWVFPVLMRPLPAPDTTPPVRSSGQPTGSLPPGTSETTLSLSTDEPATCKYSTVPGTSYDSMTHTFSTTGGTSHSTLITGLSDGDDYSYYVRCADTNGNQNTNDYLISFSIIDPETDLGTIAIDANPDLLNAPWTLEGPGGYLYNSNGDETLPGLVSGDYTLTWGDIAGWITPSPNPEIILLPAAGAINFSGNYTEQPAYTVRVNVAGEVYTDTAGNQWEADKAYSPGSWGYYGGGTTRDRGTGRAIAGTEDDRIYQTLRFRFDGYYFDVADGTYDVTLHFAETWHTTAYSSGDESTRRHCY
jgi:hypothetical protein